MNYYDELGVSPRASAEEIRRAYRELARLLHPDQQQEEGLRRAAERQMQRLNAIVAVLTDPVERRRYDLGLAGGPLVRLAAGKQLAARAAQAVRRSWVWVVTAGVAVAGLGYYFGSHAPAQIERIQLPAAAPGIVPQPQRPAQVPSVAKNSPPKAERTQKVAPALEPAPGVAAPTVLGSVPVAAVSPLVAAPVPPPPVPDPAPAPVGNDLEGTWLYVPPRVLERAELMYPPEYIELRLIKERGVLYGRYRARYRVTDRTLWPEVAFEFEGQPEEQTFAWRGTEGARGEVRLKLVGPGRLEVSWWASELGARLSLASGTAVLVRERE